MGRKFKISGSTKTVLEELFENGQIVFDDMDIAREIGRCLAPIRGQGDLYLGRDRRTNKTIGIIKKSGYKAKFRKKGFDSYILELMGC